MRDVGISPQARRHLFNDRTDMRNAGPCNLWWLAVFDKLYGYSFLNLVHLVFADIGDNLTGRCFCNNKYELTCQNSIARHTQSRFTRPAQSYLICIALNLDYDTIDWRPDC